MNDLEKILQLLREFVAERDWEQFHDPKNLSMAIASEAGELLAEFRWVSNRDADEHVKMDGVRGRVEAEIADVAIPLLLFCDRAGIDLEAAIRKKLETNRRNYPAGKVRGRSERPDREDLRNK